MKPQVEITLVYYTTRNRGPPEKLRLFQTLIYGSILDVEVEPKGMRGCADFRLVKDSKNDFAVSFGKNILAGLKIKTLIIEKSKKRIADFRRKVEAGRAQSGDRETFIVKAKGDI